MPLDPSLFDDFFDPMGDWGMGRRVLWQRAKLCACQNARPGSPAANCEFCWGTGHCYDAEEEVIVGVTAYEVRRDWKPIGPVPEGSVTITIPVHGRNRQNFRVRNRIYDEIGDFDRFLLTDAEERREIPLEKDVRDNHMQPRISKVLACRVGRGAEPTLSFREHEDFVIEGYRVRWFKGPLKGTRYILDVLAHPCMYVFNSRPMHRNHGVELPKRIIATPADMHDRSRRIGLGTGG